MEQIENIRLQPIMNLASSQIHGYEVLSGLNPDKCNVSYFETQTPDDQLSLCKKQMQVLSCYPIKGKLFFNLRINTLLSNAHIKKFIRSFTSCILELQDPENLFYLQPDETIRLLKNIERLSAAGFEVWLDDYQPQYRKRLQQLGWIFDGVKLDYSLLHKNRATPDSLNKIITEAQIFGKDTLIEGVESPDDVFIALNTQANFVQGFFWPEFSIPFYVDSTLCA